MRINPVSIKHKVEETTAHPYGRPTDIIGFSNNGKSIARMLAPIVSVKEVCFFDETIKSDSKFHYMDFPDMLEKTEIMVFTIELPEKYYKDLTKLNKKVKIFLPGTFEKTIAALVKRGFSDNLVLI